MEELIKGVTYEENDIETEIKLNLDGLATLSKAIKLSTVTLTPKQIKVILDNYYQAQDVRISVENQIRAIELGADETIDDALPAVAWLLKDAKNRELQIKKMIEAYVKEQPVCRWASSIKGIGPIYAATLWSAIDMNKCKHANQFLSYVGLNDNNVPWQGTKKAEIIVNESYKKFGLKASDDATDDVLMDIAARTGRKNLHSFKEGFERHLAKTTANNHKSVLIKYVAMPPYNTNLKSICYLIGKSFHLNMNRNSKYGKLFSERLAYENYNNDQLLYKDQAKKLLAEKNYAKNTDTYKCLIQGKLSPAHLTRRAERYAVKIFITHFFEAAWTYTYGTKPPVIYPIAHQGHVDYIEPEVPYDNLK